MKISLKSWLVSLILLALIVYLIGAMLIDVMDIDSSHYAEMSREMFENDDYLVIKNRTVDDYLDKPPMIFWFTSLIYSIFGVSAFTFRIPAILASILGAYSVYRFTRIYYNKESGWVSSMILITSQVYFIYNHNFLTDILLANFTIFSIWQLSEYLERGRWPFFLGSFTGLALAMLSKGPLGLMVPVAGFSMHFMYKRQWKNFFRWEWLAGIFLILFLLLPMAIGLYRQFGDLGLQFFFWTQSFGRITGQSHWYDQSSPFYFIHTFLWFFLPWTVAAIYGLFRSLRRIFFKRLRERTSPEIITIGGFLLSFLALSLSKYKLPQYIIVLIPLAAVFTASSLLHIIKNEGNSILKRSIAISNYVISAMLWAGAACILIFVFPDRSLLPWIILLSGLSAFVILGTSKRLSSFRLIIAPALTIITVNLILNIHFYPKLLHFQSGKHIAQEWKKTGNTFNSNLFCYRYHSPALDFHLDFPPAVINQRKLARLVEKRNDIWIITDYQGRKSLHESMIKEEIKFESYPVQALTLEFLNARRRPEMLKNDYLLRIVNSGDKDL
jgi:4-amino-4-deoxy-L-arabinose transferase-like glycosyltransferase